MKKRYYIVARSSITGRFVSLRYARRYPRTTQTHRRSRA